KKNETNGWCKGKLSIILSRVMSHKYTISNKTLKEVMFLRKDNTLCHGNSALLELLIQLKLKDSSLLDAEQLIRQMLIPFYKNKRLNVQQGVLGESLGLFTGQTGVAYQLMRYLDESIPNVLFFEL
ncbi:lanthionine synthetase LanC family protein, partial [Staphylococcus simulans]